MSHDKMDPCAAHLMNHGQVNGPHQAECHGTDLPSSAVIDFGQHITQLSAV